MEIQQREQEEVVILDLSGRLTVGEPATKLKSTLQHLTEQGRTRVVLNMADVDYVDSSGLGALVMSFTALQKAGGALKLLKLSERNLELLVLTKLTTVFELFDDERDAVNSFFPNRGVRRFDILSFVQQQEPGTEPDGK